MKFQRILKASNSQQIDAVIADLPVNANGYFMTEEQMESIEASLEELAGASQQYSDRIAELQASIASDAELIAAANTAQQNQTARIAELEAQLAEERAKPAGEMQSTSKPADKTGTEKPLAHLDPENSLNRAADARFK